MAARCEAVPQLAGVQTGIGPRPHRSLGPTLAELVTGIAMVQAVRFARLGVAPKRMVPAAGRFSSPWGSGCWDRTPGSTRPTPAEYVVVFAGECWGCMAKVKGRQCAFLEGRLGHGQTQQGP